MSLLLHIIVTYIKENIIAKLQELYSPTRNPKTGRTLPALFLKKPLCTGDLSPTRTCNPVSKNVLTVSWILVNVRLGASCASHPLQHSTYSSLYFLSQSPAFIFGNLLCTQEIHYIFYHVIMLYHVIYFICRGLRTFEKKSPDIPRFLMTTFVIIAWHFLNFLPWKTFNQDW